ncbi:perlucin-like [Toxorhynchites rutilus septentrionalis]|uniref:perlucin-like n=1 Tax=Toxorhynchites rutilus septentrionalis TaxID=329112 RepID=UPI0024789C93|nr:perlucin-like [Toxorhynchites rutilus septentrionalis]
MYLNFVSLVIAVLCLIYVVEPKKSYHIPSIEANWFKANEFCNSLGMRLAVIKSKEENDAIGEFVRTTDKFSEINCSFWIGATDLAKEGLFIWTPTGERLTWTNWRRGEPNDESGEEDCLQLAYIPSLEYNWNWNDNSCSGQSFHFICESSDTNCVTQF